MKHYTIKFSLLAYLLLTTLPLCRFTTMLYARGISSPCGIMRLHNLKIGQAYRLEQVLGYPFSVKYNGNSKEMLLIFLQSPPEPHKGYEPAPDLNWFELEKSSFTFSPGADNAETDILIKIPKNKKYLGEKYVLHIYSRTVFQQDSGQSSSQNISLGMALMCKLYFEISSSPPTKKEIKQLKKSRKK
ncbi:MAG: hypothetical protein KKH91_05840 [Elusimicrobia bacterium]|nr:hypothetical protein [Elusimicrobiota bacterium]MBU2614043.1 hypothetical protein [Elusimicrobiota bacterium]